MLEMLLNQCDLIRCTRILRNNSHHPSRLSHLEYVDGFRHIKGHYAMRHLVYVLLPRLSKHNRSAEKHKNGDHLCETGHATHILLHG